jgi:hypothetical protein
MVCMAGEFGSRQPFRKLSLRAYDRASLGKGIA